MADAWLPIALTILADGLAGLSGGLLSERWLSRHHAALIGFAAGALVAAVFLDVLPEAVAIAGRGALTWAFVGFVAMALIEHRLGHHHARGEGGAAGIVPLTLLVSDALHNVADGAAVAAAFLSSAHAGLGVAVGVVAHELPQEVGDYALLRAAGWGRGRALAALAGVQLTAAAGAVGVMLAATHFQRLVAVVLSLAAGTFLYIAATDLLPEIHSGRTPAERRRRMAGFLCGIAVLCAIEAAA
jgi:zinc and cadmium transporter